MKIECANRHYKTEFNFKVFPVLNEQGKPMEGALSGMVFFYTCPKCEAPLNIEITFVPKNGFKSLIKKRQSDYIG